MKPTSALQLAQELASARNKEVADAAALDYARRVAFCADQQAKLAPLVAVVREFVDAYPDHFAIVTPHETTESVTFVCRSGNWQYQLRALMHGFECRTLKGQIFHAKTAAEAVPYLIDLFAEHIRKLPTPTPTNHETTDPQ